MGKTLQDCKVAFIGGGNMASAIIKGLISRGMSKQSIIVSEPWEVNRKLMDDIGVKTTTVNVEAAEGVDVVVIAVKPQVAKTVCQEFASAWAKRDSLPVVVSIAAGIGISSMQRWLATEDGKVANIVRVMPNTPALAGEGASGLVASENVTPEQKDLVDALFKSVSPVTEWVSSEELLDVVTGLSGMFPTLDCETNRWLTSFQDPDPPTSLPWLST